TALARVPRSACCWAAGAGAPPPAPGRLNWHDRRRPLPTGIARAIELACIAAASRAGFGRGRQPAPRQVTVERSGSSAVVGLDIPDPPARQRLHPALAGAD